MSRKSLYWAQALDKTYEFGNVNSAYAGDAGILLLIKGKLTIGKVKSSHLDTDDRPTHRDLQHVAK
jgi:hypothetical protein